MRLAPEVPLAAIPWAVVDVETTGHGPRFGDRVTEIAVVTVHDGRVTDRFAALVNPQRHIPPEITRLTGITWQMVRDEPPFRAIADRVRSHLTDRVFVAHNARFDWAFVADELDRSGAPVPDTPQLCTVRLARRLLSHLPRRNLDAVCAHYGVRIDARHRALGDAEATAQCLLGLLEDATRQGLHTWGDLQGVLARRTGMWRALPAAADGAEGA